MAERSGKRIAKRIGWLTLSVIAIAVVYLLAWPVEIDPLAWHPPTAPTRIGVLTPNQHLKSVKKIPTGVGGQGPEDVAIDADGRMYVGLLDGRILRYESMDAREEFVDTQGRPLGLDFDPEGNLIVADAIRGLLRITIDGDIAVLSTEHNGVPYLFTDDVDVASDGKIYFTDASSKRGLGEYKADFFEQRGVGRLLMYDPQNSTTTLLMDGLNFANGVALSPDEDFVVVVETARYCLHRYWLKGERAGTSDLFAENLPGFPDGVSCNGEDRFWVALVSPRSPVLDAVHPHPWVKRMMARLPESVHPSAKAHGWLLGLDIDGTLSESLEDSTGEHFAYVTSVEEHDGMLYLGSLELDCFGRIARPESR